jgi:hypothetical protein
MRAWVKHSNQRVAMIFPIFGVAKEMMNYEERLLRLADHASLALHNVRKETISKLQSYIQPNNPPQQYL